MKPIPSRLRIVLFALAALLSAGLMLGGHYYLQLTADVEAAGLEAPNTLDARELERKLTMFDEALKSSRHGFIRLSEVEINSYLHEHYPGKRNDGEPDQLSDGCRLIRCRADLTGNEVIFYSWVQMRWHHRAFGFCWQRTAALHRAADRWEFALKSMRVGRQEIRPELWRRVDTLFQTADQGFQEEFAWLMGRPALEIKPSELSQAPELRLYTFPDAGALRAAQ
ncbi:MAG: hypothetical protein ACYDH9_02930 [Limisphaerales bacterium]